MDNLTVSGPEKLSFVFYFLQSIFWILTYVLIVRVSFRQKTFGMPLAALSANLAWEFLYAFVFQSNPMKGGGGGSGGGSGLPFLENVMFYVEVVWFGIDLLILYAFYKYGRKYFPKNLNASLFVPNMIFALIIGFVLQYTIYRYLQDGFGMEFPGVLTAFAQNLLMSILFVTMLIKRNSTEGQTMYIAIFKMVGTMCAAIGAFVVYPYLGHSNFDFAGFLPAIGLFTIIYDLAYCILLYQQFKKEGKNPWKLIRSKYADLDEKARELQVD